MPRPKKKQIKLDTNSVLALLQEIYNECVEQRNTAIRIQNKMLSFMHGPDDLTLLGPVIKEQQKIIDSTIEKKIQLSKIQSNLTHKETEGGSTPFSFSLDDKDTLNALLNKESDDKEDTKYKM
tara:strand:- start:55 stop:423 length:369 start_codon:yes stop_codon:yes gene_type:complete